MVSLVLIGRLRCVGPEKPECYQGNMQSELEQELRGAQKTMAEGQAKDRVRKFHSYNTSTKHRV
jgi:hypothetical protein